VGADVEVDGASFDSRHIQPAQCFFALVADRDGHAFVTDAYSAGARLCVVEPARLTTAEMPSGCARVEVKDTMAALTALGSWARDRLHDTASGRVIGVTGSAGKTSTKDFISAVLRAGFPHAYASELSFNNDIGVPTTLLNAPDRCDAIVIEMGMRGHGEISRLCDVARPNIGVITSIGEAHSVSQAKGELLRALPSDGIAIVSADDPRAMAAVQTSRATLCTFGQSQAADVRYEIEEITTDGCIDMTIRYLSEQARVVVPVPGEHMASNAAAAIAVGLQTGLSLNVCADAIARATVSYMRMQWIDIASGVRIMNDAYNANPDSMVAAMKTLASVPAENRVAIVGRMAEIADARDRHMYVATVAQQLGLTLWPVDTDLYGIASITIDEAAHRVGTLAKDSVVLLKGSRIAGLERIIDLLGVAPPSKK
jgi:UDP-N-acetylmuramoyl-tripeptide--D-alanyl-D-alanine ligase